MATCCTRETGIEEYIETLKGQARRIPLSGTLELTHRCNNRCVHCYVNEDAGDMEKGGKELTLTEICNLIDAFAENGCLWLLLTGGEPLLREDFEEIYMYAKKKGLLVTIFTNGTSLNSSHAELFKEYTPRTVEITLYGATKSTYEKMTRTLGSFDRCMKGIQILLDQGIPLRLKTLVTTVNKHEFFEIKDFADSRGIDFRFDALINARISRNRDVTKVRIPPNEVVEMDQFDPGRKRDFLRLFERKPGQNQRPHLLYNCGGGINNFHVDPYGHLQLCSMSRTPSYDLRSGSFEEGWYDFFPSVRRQEFQHQTRCATCALRAVCDQCPGWAQLEHGDPEAPVDYLCEVAHLRAGAYGLAGFGETTEQRIG